MRTTHLITASNQLEENLEIYPSTMPRFARPVLSQLKYFLNLKLNFWTKNLHLPTHIQNQFRRRYQPTVKLLQRWNNPPKLISRSKPINPRKQKNGTSWIHFHLKRNPSQKHKSTKYTHPKKSLTLVCVTQHQHLTPIGPSVISNYIKYLDVNAFEILTISSRLQITKI